MILLKRHISSQYLLSAVLVFFLLPARAQNGHRLDSLIKVLQEQDTTAYVTSGDTSKPAGEEEASAPEQYVLRQLPDTLVHRWKNDRAYAYANDPDYWRKEKEKTHEADPRLLLWLFRLLSSPAFYYTLYTLLGLLLLYVIIRIIIDNNVRLFYRSSKRKKGQGPDQSEDETEEDLNQRLKDCLLAKDYRQATRYLYLISLSLMNEKQLIKRHADATNHEYVSQLRGSAWESPFRFLTGLYEKVWYGDFALQESQFTRLHRYFEDFFKTVAA